jgi:SAM-dependent methyltransferase
MSEKHYFEQIKHTEKYLIPYFKNQFEDFENFKVLEVGCAEGGFLELLAKMAMDVCGLELSPQRVTISKQKNPTLDVRVGDITNPAIVEELNSSFDLIVFRDVIEHIPDRTATFENINKLLKPGGSVFFSFPPRFSGFAGHQQVGKSLLRYVPYWHLLPAPIIKLLGKLFHEHKYIVDNAILNFKIGLSIRQFEKYYAAFNFVPTKKELFLFRPIYKIRFNINPLRFPNIPLLREFFAFGCECILKKN